MTPTSSIAIAQIVAEIAALVSVHRDPKRRIMVAANGRCSGGGYGGSRAVGGGEIEMQNLAVVALNGTWKRVEMAINELRQKLVEKDRVQI